MTAPILVAGAGIGGLAAALAMARAGRAVRLLERAPAITEIGAGLQIAPNAGRVLARLGLGPAMDAIALTPRAINVRRGRDGDILARLDLSDALARWGAPFRVFHRADLQQLLLRAVATEPQIVTGTGARVTGYATQGAGVGVFVETADGPATIDAAGLVGADGEHSTVRATLAPEGAAARRYAGVVAWRALVPAAEAPASLRAPETHIWLTPGAHIVNYPLRDGAMINVVIAVTEPHDGDYVEEIATRAGDDMARALAARGAAPKLCALIAAGESWRRWPFFVRPALTRWSDGAVTLLGDAAHPMPPFLAQGAAQAIEDAEALGHAFAQTPEAPVARIFAAYEASRIARASRVARASRRQGDLDHLGGFAAAVRDLGIRALGGRGLMLRNAWLYR